MARRPSKSESGADQEQVLLEQAIASRGKVAESEIELARLFIARGQIEIARRRLRHAIELCRESAAADVARRLLKTV